MTRADLEPGVGASEPVSGAQQAHVIASHHAARELRAVFGTLS